MRAVKWFILLIALWLITISSTIWHYGTKDNAAPADCIIVLGAAVQGNEPTPVFAERIRHAVNLYQRGLAEKIIFTGGKGEGNAHSESSVARTFAQRLGIPDTAIYSEENSHTTQQNLAEAAALMRLHGLHSAIVVSDPLHLKRAMWMAQDAGIKAVSSPTPSSMYRSLATQLPFLVREVYFTHHYAFKGLLVSMHRRMADPIHQRIDQPGDDEGDVDTHHPRQFPVSRGRTGNALPHPDAHERFQQLNTGNGDN